MATKTHTDTRLVTREKCPQGCTCLHFQSHPSLVTSSRRASTTDTLASRSSVLPLTGGLGQAGQGERHLSTISAYNLLHCTTSPSAQRDTERWERSIMQWKRGNCNHQAWAVTYLFLNVLFVCYRCKDGHEWNFLGFSIPEHVCLVIFFFLNVTGHWLWNYAF